MSRWVPVRFTTTSGTLSWTASLAAASRAACPSVLSVTATQTLMAGCFQSGSRDSGLLLPLVGDPVEGVVVQAHATEVGQGAHRHGADDGEELLLEHDRRLPVSDLLLDELAAGRVSHPLLQRGVPA
jgi:hypothetical protein